MRMLGLARRGFSHWESSQAGFRVISNSRVVPRDGSLMPVAVKLMADLEARYPPFDATLPGYQTSVSLGSPAVRCGLLARRQSFKSYITNPSYRNIDVPKISAAVVINSGPPALDYTIRMNSSSIPVTIIPQVFTLQRGTNLQLVREP